MNLWLGAGEVKRELNNLGAVIGDEVPMKPINQAVSFIQIRGIIFFHKGDKNAICHSAYVVNVAEDASDTVI